MTTKYGSAVLAGTQKNVLNQMASNVSPAKDKHFATYINALYCGSYFAGGEIDSEQEIYDHLLSSTRSLGMADGDARKQIRNGIRKGMAQPKVRPDNDWVAPKDQYRRIELLNQWWADIESNSDLRAAQKVLAKTLAERAITSKSNSFDGSYRTISLASGLGLRTIMNAIEGLPNLRVEKGSRITGKPTTWTLLLDSYGSTDQHETVASYSTGATPLFPSGSDGTDITHQSHNAWTKRQNDWLVYMYLRSLDHAEPIVSVIAKAAGCHPTTAKRSLRRLISLNLVTQTEDGFAAREGDSFDEEAHEIEDVRSKRTIQYMSDRPKFFMWTIGRLLKNARKRIPGLAERLRIDVSDKPKLIDTITGQIITNPWQYAAQEFGV